MKLLIKIIVLILLAYYTPKFVHDKTDGFMLSKIRSNLNFDPRWETSHPSTACLGNIFSQPFHYIGCGGQSYVFESEDGQYVVKFFKHHLRRLPFLVRYLPLSGSLAKKREAQRLKREKKLKRDFLSYKLGFENMQNETQLVYIHLNKTNTLNQKAHIIDKIGIKHSIDLDQFEFLVQKKGHLALDYIEKLARENKMDEAKKAIESIVELIIVRSKKGVYDEDAKIHRNFGFFEGRAMLIDAGRLKPDERRLDPKIQYNDLKKITARLKSHLSKLSPELEEHLNKYVESKRV